MGSTERRRLLVLVPVAWLFLAGAPGMSVAGLTASLPADQPAEWGTFLTVPRLLNLGLYANSGPQQNASETVISSLPMPVRDGFASVY
jgi:hypothetical protein